MGIELPKEAIDGIPYALQVTSSKSIINTDGTDDTQIIVSVVDENENRINCTLPVTLSVNGPGIFPTGKILTMSPETNTFIDGMGAMEFRSYFSGESIITAVSDGLISASIIIKSIGGETWKDQKINHQLPPPSLMKMPKPNGERAVVSRNKPVFCSSFKKDHPAPNIVNTDASLYWEAETEESGQWVMVDMEGCWFIDRISIRFKQYKGEPFIVSVSEDGVKFTPVETTIDTGKYNEKMYTLRNLDRRYFKIHFTQNPVKIEFVDLSIQY